MTAPIWAVGLRKVPHWSLGLALERREGQDRPSGANGVTKGKTRTTGWGQIVKKSEKDKLRSLRIIASHLENSYDELNVRFYLLLTTAMRDRRYIICTIEVRSLRLKW